LPVPSLNTHNRKTMDLKILYIFRWIGSIWKVVKCGVGEG
jgi:hypothetical protein